jgi:hypothetical protein
VLRAAAQAARHDAALRSVLFDGPDLLRALLQLADRMEVSQPVIAALEGGLRVGLNVDFPLLAATTRAGEIAAS